MVKRGPRGQLAPLHQELNGAPFDHVVFNVIGPLAITGNINRFILTMIVYCCKWLEDNALPNHKAETVAECIISCCIAHHGTQIRIYSDNAPEFRGYVINQPKKRY